MKNKLNYTIPNISNLNKNQKEFLKISDGFFGEGTVVSEAKRIYNHIANLYFENSPEELKNELEKAFKMPYIMRQDYLGNRGGGKYKDFFDIKTFINSFNDEYLFYGLHNKKSFGILLKENDKDVGGYLEKIKKELDEVIKYNYQLVIDN